ncbi:MAG TPA: hypothetical protein VGH20_14865 [Myxococcales bacterium]|jgi:hypothetical protein
MTNARDRFQYRRNLQQHLRQQSVLTGHPVAAADLVPLEEVAVWRSRVVAMDTTARSKVRLPFEDKVTPVFDAYVRRLEQANPSQVYLWTPLASICGPAMAPSIAQVNFAFPFDVNVEGIVSFISADFRDELVLDYYEEQEQYFVDVEARGARWPHCDFGGGCRQRFSALIHRASTSKP